MVAEILMIECDNPECESVGTPEHVPGEFGRKKKDDKVMGPYGWHQGDGWLVGCGPAYTYHACSGSCVGPAIEHVLYEARERENGK